MLGNTCEDELMSDLRHLTRDADPRANQILAKEDIINEPTVICLTQRCDELSEALKSTYLLINNAPKDDPVLQQYQECRRQLRALKARISRQLLTSRRDQFFEDKSRAIIHAQLDGTESIVSTQLELSRTLANLSPEQVFFSALPDDMSVIIGPNSDNRAKVMQVLVDMCARTEQRRGRPSDVCAAFQPTASTSLPKEEVTESKIVPVILHNLQCVFCVGDETLSERQRWKRFVRPQILWDHVSRMHLKTIDAKQAIACAHPACKERVLVLSNLQHLLSHSQKEHGVRLQKG